MSNILLSKKAKQQIAQKKAAKRLEAEDKARLEKAIKRLNLVISDREISPTQQGVILRTYVTFKNCPRRAAGKIWQDPVTLEY